MSTGITSPLDFILGRRSVRVYSPGEVSEAAVTQLLQAAAAAPSAMTRDPWRFVVVRDKETMSKLSSLHPGAAMLATAALAIVVCGDVDAAFERNVSYLVQDCSAATENLLLAAHALGLGACWVGVYPSEPVVKRVKECLGLPGTIIPLAVVSLGRPGEQLEARTRLHASQVHREKW